MDASGSIVIRCEIAAPTAPPSGTPRGTDAEAVDQQWYEPEADRIDRVALVYFRDVCTNELRRATNSKPDIDEAKRQAIVEKAKATVARRLGKAVEQLDPLDLLDDTDARFKVLTASFRKDIGHVAWPTRLSADERAIWRRLAKQRDYVMSVLVVYPTDRRGAIDDARLSSGRRVMRWRFEPQTYELLRQANSRLRRDGGAISGSDLYVTRAGHRTRNIKVSVAGPAVYRRYEAMERAVLGEAMTLAERLAPFGTMTTGEVQEQLTAGRDVVG